MGEAEEWKSGTRGGRGEGGGGGGGGEWQAKKTEMLVLEVAEVE